MVDRDDCIAVYRVGEGVRACTCVLCRSVVVGVFLDRCGALLFVIGTYVAGGASLLSRLMS